MKLADYVWDFISNLGTTHVFMIVGGANSHLVDSLSRNKRLKYICPITEQAAAMAAEGYARVSGKPGAILVTSGPGGTNAITGLCGAFCDSIPVIFISGQVPSNLYTDGTTIRQLGVQQINIVDGVKGWTKYAVMVTNPKDIRYIMEKAAYLMENGRPGPVWIDIPTELQRAEIDPWSLHGYYPVSEESRRIDEMPQVINSISNSERPIIIAGHGIRLAGAVGKFREFINELGIPVISSWNGIDILPHDHPLYIGSAGVRGQRGSNFAVANSDLILAIGSRMDTRQVGNDRKSYARAAKKIVVDAHADELQKGIINIDIPIIADAGQFIDDLLRALPSKRPDISDWVKRCQEWRAKYPIVLPEYYANPVSGRVNSYVLVNEIAKQLGANDIVVTDMGASLTCTMQTFFVKGNQRLFTNIGFASMGFGLPAAIGAWFGRTDKSLNRVVGIFGDGGFQMNIQELQTVFYHKIPIKIFIENNEGYLTIKGTQRTYFGGNIAGCDFESGYSVPSFHRVAVAYNIPSFVADDQGELPRLLEKVLEIDGPVLCEVMMPRDQALIPLSSLLDKTMDHKGSPLERMYPYLPDDEFRENMPFVEPVGDNITKLPKREA